MLLFIITITSTTSGIEGPIATYKVKITSRGSALAVDWAAMSKTTLDQVNVATMNVAVEGFGGAGT